MKNPLVSVIVTTRNSEATLEACLHSVQQQTYTPLEIVFVDNFSTDRTVEIARQFTDNVTIKGPERSVQRNEAARLAKGEYIVVIDSDMELTPTVIESCVAQYRHDDTVEGVVIPEESFGEGFWAQCKKLERSFYIGVDWIEAARFFKRQTFLEVGGYDEQLVSGEDWDLAQRVAAKGRIAHVDALIMHNEGRLQLLSTLKKKFYYAGQFRQYTATTSVPAAHGKQPTNIVLRRFGLYFSQPKQLFKKPHYGLGMLFMKVSEFGFGALGYLAAKNKKQVSSS